MKARTGFRTRTALFIGCVLLLTLQLVSAQTPVDPQSLVGEWRGSWVDKRQGKVNGQYSLTIDKVDGDKVSGTGVLSGRRTTEFKFNGTLAGDRLTFGRETVTDLVIQGTQMRGTSEGPNAARSISLTKQP